MFHSIKCSLGDLFLIHIFRKKKKKTVMLNGKENNAMITQLVSNLIEMLTTPALDRYFDISIEIYQTNMMYANSRPFTFSPSNNNVATIPPKKIVVAKFGVQLVALI